MLVATYKLLKSFFVGFKEEETRGVSVLIIITLVSGTAFYSSVEKLAPLDALTFCFSTLSTIGYSDFSPQTSLGKIFTIVYAIVGVGLMAMFIYLLFRSYISTKKFKK